MVLTITISHYTISNNCKLVIIPVLLVFKIISDGRRVDKGEGIDYSVCGFKELCLKLKVHSQILIAIVLGVVAGLLLGEKAGHIKFIGDIFIRLLRMIIIPLILASMVAGIVSLGDVRKLGNLGSFNLATDSAVAQASVSVPHGFIKGLRRTRWRTSSSNSV